MTKAEQYKELADKMCLLCTTLEMQLNNFNEDLVPHLEAFIEGKLPALSISTDELEKIDGEAKRVQKAFFDKVNIPLLNLLEPIRKACSISYGIRKQENGNKVAPTTKPKAAKEEKPMGLTPSQIKAIQDMLKAP